MGADHFNYYLQGNTFAPAQEFPSFDMYDAWPTSPTDYWIVGKPNIGQQFNVLHGDPAGAAAAPALGSPSYPPIEPEPPYKVVGKTLLEKDGNDWVPLKTFDDAFTGTKYVAFSISHVWVCNGNQIHQFDGTTWSSLGYGCTFLQVDGDEHLWVNELSVNATKVRVYNVEQTEVRELPAPIAGIQVEDFAVRGHEAWILAQLTALRWNGSAWDEYALGVTPDDAPGSITVTAAGTVYFGGGAYLRFDP